MSAVPPVSIAALRGVRLTSGAVVDVALDGDEVLAVVPTGSPLPDTDGVVLDLPATCSPPRERNPTRTSTRRSPGMPSGPRSETSNARSRAGTPSP